MTILIKMGQQENRWDKNLTFRMDLNDIRDMTWDYTGELGTDTIDTASATANDITAGTPSISSNVVTTQISAGQEGATATLDLEIVTTAGATISRTVKFKIEDM